MKKLEKAEVGGQNVNRRGAPRIPAQELPGLGLKIWNGGTIRLLDLSQTGARFESDRRLVPAARVTLQFITSDQPLTVHGMVVRVRLTRVERSAIYYEVAMAFDKPVVNLNLPDSKARAALPTNVPAPASAPSVAAAKPAADNFGEPADSLVESTGKADDDPYHEVSEMLLVAHVTQSHSELWQVINGNEW